MKRCILYLSFLLFSVCTSGQKLEIDWIEIPDNKVVVHYLLDDPNPNHQYLVSLFSSQDNFTTALTNVTGDVGTEIKPGREKSITWDITKEFPSFKGNLIFELRGRVFVPFVKLTRFEGGRVYKRGRNYPLNWTSGNLSGQINIELFKGQERIPVENNVPNVGKYQWRISSGIKKGNDYRLKFTNSKDRNDFVYSEVFSIKPKVAFMIKALSVATISAGILFIAGSGGSGESSIPPEEPLPDNPGKPN